MLVQLLSVLIGAINPAFQQKIAFSTRSFRLPRSYRINFCFWRSSLRLRVDFPPKLQCAICLATMRVPFLLTLGLAFSLAIPTGNYVSFWSSSIFSPNFTTHFYSTRCQPRVLRFHRQLQRQFRPSRSRKMAPLPNSVEGTKRRKKAEREENRRIEREAEKAAKKRAKDLKAGRISMLEKGRKMASFYDKLFQNQFIAPRTFLTFIPNSV